MTDTLLRTKLYVPQRPVGRQRPSLVPRPHLIDKLNAGLAGKLTLISAPAGFGKTTLIASHVADSGLLVAWLSLDKDDNRNGRFLNYLIAALQQVDHTIGREIAQSMKMSQQLPYELALTNLINDLDTANREIYLILDDYHLISSQTVHDAVSFLLEHGPNTFHLVVASRSDPPIPLARLRARGQMVELRAADLRFTEAEAAQFFNNIMELPLDAASVAKLTGRTEGWIAGLQMAALSLGNREDVTGFVESFSGTNRYILDYLLEEILAKQSPEIQHFLLYTSILERLTAPLCDAILSNDDRFEPGIKHKQSHKDLLSPRRSASILDYLERENLFLISLDDDRIWFRYHHLFADLLKARLHQAQPDLIPGLHTRASTWLEQNGYIPEAVGHHFAAGKIDQAADLIECCGPAHWAENGPSVVQMAESLPPEMLIARPKIGLHQAWLLIIQGQIGKAIPLLNELAQKLAGADPNSGQQWMQTLISLALTFLNPTVNASQFDPFPDETSLAKIPASEFILRDAADILYGMTLSRRGEIDRAAEVSARYLQRIKTSQGTPLTIPTIVPFLARIYLMQGRLQAAASLCREFLAPIEEEGFRSLNSVGDMNIVLGEALYERNLLAEAEQRIRDSLQANELWKNIMTDAFGLIALARVLQAKGDYIEAAQIVEKFEARLQGPSRPRDFEEELRTLGVRLQLASGDFQNPSHWADQIQLSEDFALHPGRYRRTLARIRLTQSRYADVEALLTGTVPLSKAGNRITAQIESNLLLAAAIAGQGGLTEAFGLIEACLALAEPEGYVRIFLDVGKPVRELLAAYLRSDAPIHRLYAQKILDAFPTSVEPGSADLQPAGLAEPLTEREVEVLQIMALGKTNKAIARQLIIAPGTVKAHTASIYRKLDVANRTEAVARARGLGILP